MVSNTWKKNENYAIHVIQHCLAVESIFQQHPERKTTSLIAACFLLSGCICESHPEAGVQVSAFLGHTRWGWLKAVWWLSIIVPWLRILT